MIHGCAPDYSDGYRVGTIQKFSKKGFFWKSWEGEMIMQNIATDDKGNSLGFEKFEFNVALDDHDTNEAVQKAMDSGKKCKLTYRQYGIAPITQDTDHVAIKCEILDK